MNGYLFKNKNHYYFIKSSYKRKNKTLATIFLNYFLCKQKNVDNISKLVIDNTFNKIYNEMKQVEIRPSTDNSMYFIREKQAGETIFQDELIIVETN